MRRSGGLPPGWPDRVIVWATAVGFGLAGIMPAWMLMSRLTALVWDPPLGPLVALVASLALGAVITWASLTRLVRTGHLPSGSHVSTQGSSFDHQLT